MSLRNLTREQLAEDYRYGTNKDRDVIQEELNRRADEREERACRAEDERKDE